MNANILGLPPLVQAVVDRGIEVMIRKDKDGEYYFDLNSSAKSHMHLYLDTSVDGNHLVKKRYEEVDKICDVTDLLYSFKGAMWGRDFGHSLWIDWAVEEGVIIKETTTTTSYR